jgi:hypothetical protein
VTVSVLGPGGYPRPPYGSFAGKGRQFTEVFTVLGPQGVPRPPYGSFAGKVTSAAPFTPFSWRFGQDDAAVWSYVAYRNALLFTAQPFAPTFWQFKDDDAAVWTGQSVGNILRILTSQTPQKPHFWRYDYDDASATDRPIPVNFDLLFAAQAVPLVPTFWSFNYDDAASWQWQQPYNVAIANPGPPVPPVTGEFTVSGWGVHDRFPVNDVVYTYAAITKRTN